MPQKLDTLFAVSTDALAHEFDTNERLTSRAEQYLTAVAVVLAIHAFVPLQHMASVGYRQVVALIILACGVCLLVVAAYVAIYCVRMQKYPTYPATSELNTIVETTASDAEVVKGVSDMLLEMRDAIRPINDRRVRLIKVTRYLVLVGFVVSICARVGLLFV